MQLDDKILLESVNPFLYILCISCCKWINRWENSFASKQYEYSSNDYN